MIPQDPLENLPRIPRKKRDDSWIKEIILISAAIALSLHFLGFFTAKKIEEKWGLVFPIQKEMEVPPPATEKHRPEFIETRILPQPVFEKILVQSKKVKSSERNANETSRFSGEQTQRVERETRSSKFGDPEASGRVDRVGEAGEKTIAKVKTPKKPNLFGVGDSVEGKVVEVKEEGTGQVSSGQNLVKSERARGTRDKLPSDIAVGAETILNTDEYVYASFFNRMKSEVGPRWDPMIQRVLNDPHSRIAEGEYITQTQFVCDKDGNIESVDILRRSGVLAFDDAAERAILQTRRVANPPQALLDLDGRFRVKLGFQVTVRSTGIQTDYIPDSRYQKIPGL